MAISFLGRGKRSRPIPEAVAHIAGAAVGGALIGLAMATVGSWMPRDARNIIVAAVMGLAIFLAAFRPGSNIGLNRQVPRRWPTWIPHPVGMFLWGAQLGAGVTTVIPYSAHLAILAVALTLSGDQAAAIVSAFGLARELPAAIALLDRTAPPDQYMRFLRTLRTPAVRINQGLVAGISCSFALSIALVGR